MIYTLMHKDIPVVSLDMDNKGNMSPIGIVVLNAAHIPIGANTKSKLVNWWNERAIPISRQYIKEAMKLNQISSPKQLNMRNLGLSLTDCYWIKPANRSDLKWENVSLFRNNFHDYHSIISINQKKVADIRLAPASSQGELEKLWTIQGDGSIALVKGNYSYKIQQSLNEVYTTYLLRLIGWADHVSYELINIQCDSESSVGCKCLAYTNENTESISLWSLLVHNNCEKRLRYDVCLDLLEHVGINRRYADNFLNREILIDYIISNIDRHMRNIEILRDSNSLEVLGMAPMFDFGNSMFFRLNKASSIPTGKGLSSLETHSFCNRESALLKHVDKHINIATDLDILKGRALFDSIYNIDTTKDQEFYDKVYKTMCKKIDLLDNYLKQP